MRRAGLFAVMAASVDALTRVGGDALRANPDYRRFMREL
jgi:hypothetical protein